jgi:hypothetical protein
MHTAYFMLSRFFLSENVTEGSALTWNVHHSTLDCRLGYPRLEFVNESVPMRVG